MLLAHAITLSQARSYLGALAEHTTRPASIEYERVLLHLDALYDEEIPGLDTGGLTDDTDLLYVLAYTAIGELVDHGVDDLQIELVLDMLEVAHDSDRM